MLSESEIIAQLCEKLECSPQELPEKADKLLQDINELHFDVMRAELRLMSVNPMINLADIMQNPHHPDHQENNNE